MNSIFATLHRRSNVILGLAILALCILDFFNSFYIFSKGGIEINPFMNIFIEDRMLFFLVKMLLTSIGVFILVYYNKTLALKSILVIYLILTIYSLTIIWSI